MGLGLLSILSVSSVLMLVPGRIAWCSDREDSEKSTEKLQEVVWKESGLWTLYRWVQVDYSQ